MYWLSGDGGVVGLDVSSELVLGLANIGLLVAAEHWLLLRRVVQKLLWRLVNWLWRAVHRLLWREHGLLRKLQTPQQGKPICNRIR